MTKVAVTIILVIIGVAAASVSIVLPSLIFPRNSNLPIDVVAAFLSFDGIMVAAVAFMTQSPILGRAEGSLMRPYIIDLFFFVGSASLILYSFHDYNAYSDVIAVRDGWAFTIGLSLTVAGLISFLVLLVAALISESNMT